MNPRTRSRTPASIGSNQACPVNSSLPSVPAVVIFCPMAWSPPALERRSWLVATNRRRRRQPIPPLSRRHPCYHRTGLIEPVYIRPNEYRPLIRAGYLGSETPGKFVRTSHDQTIHTAGRKAWPYESPHFL